AHDHGHEHDHGDEVEYEVDEALMATGAVFLVESVAELSAGELDELLKGLPPQIGTELVKDLIGNKLDPRRLKNLAPLLLGPLRKRPAGRLSPTVERLSVGILDTFHNELGERFDNPSFDDLSEVIDAVLAKHPLSGVRCTLSWVVADGLPAAQAAHDLLLTDERLRLPDWPKASSAQP
ncbi:MAG TPA: hypothetical protein VEG38_19480, partial [Acidimicrobiia bacterium]|nr:hypothetical protein [Acidimicrobiia bacterium]